VPATVALAPAAPMHAAKLMPKEVREIAKEAYIYGFQ
jgi:hypothetical protein